VSFCPPFLERSLLSFFPYLCLRLWCPGMTQMSANTAHCMCVLYCTRVERSSVMAWWEINTILIHTIQRLGSQSLSWKFWLKSRISVELLSM
jgi:hypothetical protein